MKLSRRAVLNIPLLGCFRAIDAPAQASRARLPDATGSKFNADGSARSFPGNTIISPVPADSAFWRALTDGHDLLRQGKFSSCLALLPPSSYHMTFFPGVVDAVRDPYHWPKDLPLDAPLTECTRLFEEKLRSFDLGCNPPFRFFARSFQWKAAAPAFQLAPVDAAENKKLRDLRDRLARRLELKKPDHDKYGFHVTTAYLVRRMTPSQAQAFASTADECLLRVRKAGLLELDAPDFCTFQNLFGFTKVFQLRRTGDASETGRGHAVFGPAEVEGRLRRETGA